MKRLIYDIMSIEYNSYYIKWFRMLYFIFYTWAGSIFVFFGYLIFLLTRASLATKKEALAISVIASILWGALIPIAFLTPLLNSVARLDSITRSMNDLPIVILGLLSAYALSNIWKKHSLEDYKNVIRFALIPFIGVALVIMSQAYLFYQNNRIIEKTDSLQSNSQDNTANTKIITATANPVDTFWKEFSSKDYKVTIEGTRAVDQALYFEKGELVRVGDPNDSSGRPWFIIKNGRVYGIANASTFKDLNATVGIGKTITDSLKLLSILDPFIRDTKKDTFLWSLIDKSQQGHLSNTKQLEVFEGNGYSSLQPWMVEDARGKLTPMSVKIFLDSSTNLMTIMTVGQSNESQLRGVTRFHYELIDDINVLKVFPSDYKMEYRDSN